MRVAFQHTDPEHPNHGVAAYRLGRVHDFTHPITGDASSRDEIVRALLEQAREEFPEADGYRAWPERLLCDDCGQPPHGAGDCDGDTSTWHEFDESELEA